VSSYAQRFRIRVYYEDTDHGGVVYYANYLKFMERGRTEYLRTAAIELDELETSDGAMFVVTDIKLHYRAPARFNDLLEVESELIELRGARVTFRQNIWRIDREKHSREELLVEGIIDLACTDRSGKATRIPSYVRTLLKKHQSLDH